MSALSKLPENSEGSAVDKFALFCALVSILCVVGAHAMDRLAQKGALPSISLERAQSAPGVDRSGVDYSATGSISAPGGVRLDPCTGEIRR
jgi:hypothetical protein